MLTKKYTKLYEKIDVSDIEMRSYRLFRRHMEANSRAGSLLYFSLHLDIVEEKHSKERDNIIAVWG